MKKNGMIRCETIDSGRSGMVKSGSLSITGLDPAIAPLPAEGKEFLLTEGRQSVMNSFTASGIVCNIFVRSL